MDFDVEHVNQRAGVRGEKDAVDRCGHRRFERALDIGEGQAADRCRKRCAGKLDLAQLDIGHIFGDRANIGNESGSPVPRR